MTRARKLTITVLLVLLSTALAGAFLTRGVMEYLPFLQAKKGNWTGEYVSHGIVDQRPWQTASTLAALAQSAEEREFAREAERLADHEVDQAFSQSLRQASLEKPKLSGKALALQQRVTELQATVKSDQARIAALTAGAGATADASRSSDLEVAKAQLGLDQNELDDSLVDLSRESGDQRVKIQQELAAREAAMKKYDDSVSKDEGQTAVTTAEQYKTLAQQISAWWSHRNRKRLIAQAEQLAAADVAALTGDQERMKAEAASDASATAASLSSAERVERLQRQAEQQKIQSILNDRLGAQQQLVALYGRWGKQVEIQDKIIIHLILQSLAVIAAICVLTMLAGWGLQVALERVFRDRQTETDAEERSESGYAGRWPGAGSAGHLRRAATDADDSWAGHGRIDAGLPGLHPGVLRLVRADGAERNQGPRLGGDRRRRRRGGGAGAVPHVAAGDGKLDGEWPSHGKKSFFSEWVCHSGKVFQLLHGGTVDVG